MKHIKRLLHAGLFVAGIALLFVSCKKINEATELGDDLIPEVDNITTFETYLDVYTDNFQLDDSTRIGMNDLMALGIIDDPAFGITKGEMYYTLTPSIYPSLPFKVADPDSIQVDSVIFTVAFQQIYGDTNSVQNLQVFEIDQSEDFDSLGLYYPISHPDFVTAAPLSNVTSVNFNTLNDAKVVVREPGDTVTVTNQLRIPLLSSVGDRFKSYDSTAGGAYKSDSLFREYFKGVALKVQGGDGRALAYFTVNNTNTSMEFYSRIKKDGVWDTTVVTFKAVRNIAANLVKRTPSAELAGNLGTPPPSVNREKLYIQSTPGTYASIRIMGLENIPNSVIHRAELQLPVVSSAGDDVFGKPRLLFLDMIDSLRDIYKTIPLDFRFSSGNYNIQSFGGYFTNERSFFNLTRYVQSVVTKGDSLYTLRLYAPFETRPWFTVPGQDPFNPYSPLFPSLIINTPVAYGRVVLGGGAHPDPAKKMRVRIVYSKI